MYLSTLTLKGCEMFQTFVSNTYVKMLREKESFVINRQQCQQGILFRLDLNLSASEPFYVVWKVID